MRVGISYSGLPSAQTPRFASAAGACDQYRGWTGGAVDEQRNRRNDRARAVTGREASAWRNAICLRGQTVNRTEPPTTPRCVQGNHEMNKRKQLKKPWV